MHRTFIKILTLKLAVGLIGTTAVLAQENGPDFSKEERFHSIYKKYNEIPTSEEAWEKVLSGRQSNSYSVQNRDTLWDISQTLFGDASYWPKVWSYNTDDIQNPHEITPQQVIKFYPGTLSEAPTVGLAAKGDAPEALPSHVLEKTGEGKLEGFKIPPPKKKSRPVVKKLPNSLPLYRLGAVNKPPVDFEISGAKVAYEPAPKYLTSYVIDGAFNSGGEIVEMETPEARLAGENETVIVRVSDVAPKVFVVLQAVQKVSESEGWLSAKGTVVEVQGEIEIIERVNDGENLFRARVKKAVNPVEIGAQLVPGKIEIFNVGVTTISNSVQAKIIGGEYHKYDHKIFGTDNLVFLNAGAKEGLQLGSTLQAYHNERLRRPNTKAIANDRQVGLIKVVHISDHFATGYVIDASADLQEGDYVGGRVKLGTPEASTAAASSGNSEIDNELNDLDSPAPEVSSPESAPADNLDNLDSLDEL